MELKPLTAKQWHQIYLALNYVIPNYDDLVEAYRETDHEGQVASELELMELRTRACLEANEAHKLALTYFSLYPKESPTITSEEMWESIDCTFGNWLNRLYENPAKSLAKANWYGKVTKAYFQMVGLPLSPNTRKLGMVIMVKNHLGIK